MAIEKALYTATATATGGRAGTAKSSDGAIDVTLSTPKELGGAGGPGTNPEQLFAAGYSACFIGALKAVGGTIGIAVPQDVSVDAEVDLGSTAGQYFIQARLNVSLPGIDRETARKLLDEAHMICPYSKATHGNINVVTNLIDA